MTRPPVHRARDQSDQSVWNHYPPHKQRDAHDTEQVNGGLRDRTGMVMSSIQFSTCSTTSMCRTRFLGHTVTRRGLTPLVFLARVERRAIRQLLERAQAIAAHESPRTTKLYDRTADEVTVEDIEKIGI